MKSGNLSRLSWGQRFALIEHYKPSDQAICQAFGIPQDELDTACELRDVGSIGTVSTKDFDVNRFSNAFATVSTVIGPDNVPATLEPTIARPTMPTIKTSNKAPFKMETIVSPGHTKNKVVTKKPNQRGRHGSKIVDAFAAVPVSPVEISQFATVHNVSVAVLRQSKRFDTSGTGSVNVRKNKDTGKLMIWRTPLEAS